MQQLNELAEDYPENKMFLDNLPESDLLKVLIISKELKHVPISLKKEILKKITIIIL